MEILERIRKKLENLDDPKNRVWGGSGGEFRRDDWNDGYDCALSAVDAFLDELEKEEKENEKPLDPEVIYTVKCHTEIPDVGWFKKGEIRECYVTEDGKYAVSASPEKIRGSVGGLYITYKDKEALKEEFEILDEWLEGMIAKSAEVFKKGYKQQIACGEALYKVLEDRIINVNTTEDESENQ